VDVAILDDSVSRRHTELVHDRGRDRWSARDLGSTNGTFVDGRRLEAEERIWLNDRAVVHVGAVALRFRLDVVSAAPVEHGVTRRMQLGCASSSARGRPSSSTPGLVRLAGRAGVRAAPAQQRLSDATQPST